MARIIKLNQIAEFMGDQVDQLVRAMTLEAEGRLKEETPVDTGRLRGNWQTKIEPKLGTISNNLPYAEPVLTGRNLPPSWNGTWRSKENQIQQNYIPHVIAKDMQDFINKAAEKISRES